MRIIKTSTVLISMLVCLAFMTACTPSPPASDPTPASPTEDLNATVAPRATPTNQPEPTNTAIDDQSADSSEPDSSDTADYIWVTQPQGIQCEDVRFKSLETAVQTLESNNITAVKAEQVEVMVLQACGYPTSIQYRVQITSAQLTEAETLGWSTEDAPAPTPIEN